MSSETDLLNDSLGQIGANCGQEGGKEFTVRRLLLSLALLLMSASFAWGQVNFDTVADVTVTGTATLVKATNAFRFALSCTNNDSGVNVRWGDAAVLAASGQRIRAGASVEIKSRGAVFMISEGANVTVSCTEETK